MTGPARERRLPAAAWVLYDFANSAYALLIAATAFPIYFKEVAWSERREQADLAWAATLALAMLLAGLLSPPLGAAADRSGLRRPAFVATTLAAIAGTAALGFADSPWGVAGLFLIAHLAYNLALFLYDSFLPLVAPPARLAGLSGLGWGAGFVGGIAGLALTWPLFSLPPARFGPGFAAVAGFYLLFALPALLWLPREGRAPAAPGGSLARVLATLAAWREQRELFRFLVAFWFLTEAVMTAIYFTAIYLATTFQFPPRRILILTLVVQAIGFPATWLAGALAARAGARRLIALCGVVWIAIVLLLAAARAESTLYLACGLMGLVIGSTQALGRAQLAALIPSGRSGEFFGLNSFSGKVAATLGPLAFGAVSSLSGSQRLAWLSLLPFLLAGLWLLRAPRRT